MAYGTSSGSPGPLERNTPFGLRPSTSAAAEIADDDAGTERTAALAVVVVHAVVADVGIGERDDLRGVRRVGQHLLVAREDGVEHDLARAHAVRRFGADGLTLERRAVGQYEQGFLHH